MRKAVRRWGLGLVPGLLLLAFAAPSPAQGKQAWLGVSTQNVTEELRDALDLKGDGVLVNRVVADGPAARAGIRKGDILTSVNGKPVTSPSELAALIGSLAPGSNASVRGLRRGVSQSFSVRLGDRPEDSGDAESWTPRGSGDDDRHVERKIRVFKDGKELKPEEKDFDFDFDARDLEGLHRLHEMPGLARLLGRPRLGVRVEKMNPDLAGYFGGTNGRGALVVEVIGDSPAEKAGIKAGDVITAVGTKNVDGADELIEAIADGEGKVSLTVVRKGVRRTIEAELGEAPRGSMTWRMRDGRAPRAPRAPMAPRAPGMMRFESGEGSELRDELKALREEIEQLKQELKDRSR